jgi:hypothetical protein
MPVKIRKNKKGGYTVRTPGGVKSKNSTLEDAKSQERLLNAVEHNPDFKPSHKKMARALMG